MYRKTLLVFALVSFTLSAIAYGNSAPVVTNVRAQPRADDSRLVDIHYDLADADGDACTVWVVISDDRGQSWGVPAYTFSGHIGDAINPGTERHIIWDTGHDVGGKIETFRARVFADDGHGADMVLVAAGSFEYAQDEWIYLPAYFIDKYEVTNERYCEFLNATDPSGLYWNSKMYISRHDSASGSYYVVVPGRERYPVLSVSYHDAEAFAAWLSTLDGVTYRLPTGPEWQKAAGWDPVEQRTYLYGFHRDTIDCSWANYNFCENQIGSSVVGFYNGVNPGTKDAKSYYGCYDMSGNLWEWTDDQGVDGKYILRGGGFMMPAEQCQTTNTGLGLDPWVRDVGATFRLIRELD